MHLEDGHTPADIGKIDGHLTVKTTGAEQGGIEHIGAVGSRDDNDAFLGIESVHLHQEGVKSLFALVVAAAETVTTAASHRINFVDEDQAGGVLASLLEHVADAASTDANKHFHEVRSANAEEAGIGLTGDGFGEQRLAGSGRAHHQDAFGNATTQLLELFRVTQKFHQFGNLILGFFDTGHVLEGGLVAVFGEEPGLRFTEAEGSLARRLDLPQKNEPDENTTQNQRGGTH